MLRVGHTTIDAHNAYELSVWWGRLLGYAENPDDPNLPEHEECLISSPDGSHRILFIDVPDDKVVKNRLHFDLRPEGESREEAIDRARALGATDVADHRTPDGRGWLVMADPEGNEFCILRSNDERVAAGDPPA